MTMDFGPLRLKLGTQAYDYEGHSYSWSRVYGGTDGSFINEADFTMGYLNARYTISPLSYVKASLSQQTYETTSGNENYLKILKHMVEEPKLGVLQTIIKETVQGLTRFHQTSFLV